MDPLQINKVLQDLVNFSKPLDELSRELAEIGWDNEVVCKLNRFHLINTLEKYLCNAISNKELEEWANLLEGREDIEYEDEYLFTEIIYKLANPALEGEITEHQAKCHMAQLEKLGVGDD